MGDGNRCGEQFQTELDKCLKRTLSEYRACNEKKIKK